MKIIISGLFGAVILLAASLPTHAQGFIYDQQSTNPPSPLGDYLDIQPAPLTQSFIPTLSAIGFVQFEFWDFSGIPNNGNNGAIVYVNLWTGSPNVNSHSATLLSSTAPVYMPNGFGSGIAGVTNFYFSTSVALTSGQTYYLQPVVLSGDNPWDVWAPGNTYPNGQLFVNGEPFTTDDLWFREGIVAPVPEPSTLALIGLGGLLVFGFKRRFKLVVPLLLATSALSVQAAGDSVVQATADAAGLAPVTTFPRVGTFWIMTTSPDGRLTALPYPALPSDLSALPAYSVAGNIYILDDTGGQLSPSSARRMSSTQAAAIAQAQAETMADLIGQILSPGTNGGGGFQYNDYHLSIDTNGLWIESLNTNSGASLWLRLHGTVSGDNYQLLSTSNLLNTNWDLGEILPYANDGYTDFSPIPTTHAASFYRAHHANPVMQIWDNGDSEELNPTNIYDPGHSGSFYLQNIGPAATNDLALYYAISGTAQNGIDYSNLTGEVTIPAYQSSTLIEIDPTADGLKPNQTVILTLLQNTNYLIDPGYYSATNNLTANPQVYPIVRGDKEQICPNVTNNIYLQASDPNVTYVILTWPTHGILNTNGVPSVTYTPTNCYEGQDSFTFKVNDGQYDSTPATVTLTITNQLFANPVAAQACRGGSVYFYLDAGDYGCGEAINYVVSAPLNGTVTNVSGAEYAYISTGTNFTGTDIFNYTVYDACGDAVTSTVTITVGDANLSPKAQSVLTATNRHVAVTLSATDSGDTCIADTNYYAYNIINGPTNGTLTGTPPNLTYWPGTNYEGADSFQFTVSDGGWVSAPATVSLYVVAGPLLAVECNPFGTAVRLEWGLDDAMQQMWPQLIQNLSDFVVYRSAAAGGGYTAIYTNYNLNQMSYEDRDTMIGQTNYYAVRFELLDAGITYQSPSSNEVKASARQPDDLIAADAVWEVTDITDTNHPVNLGSLQAPFSSYGTNQYPGLYPLPNNYWPFGATWTNHIALYIPTNTVLMNVMYSIAIDNDYQLYLNHSTNYIDAVDHAGYAVWPSFQAFEQVAPGLLHWGTNDIGVVIQDLGEINYFSMVVTTNTCGW